MPGDIYFGQALASRQAIKVYRVFLKNVDVLMVMAGLQAFLRVAKPGSLV
jgi:tryptophan synthase beta subunit